MFNYPFLMFDEYNNNKNKVLATISKITNTEDIISRQEAIWYFVIMLKGLYNTWTQCDME